ncbi:hypothetical protein N779_16475 [Vibrio coralliilyticus OCN008]|nr:hypothetical protein N779_16475 [Vibrio coralliilyticus OCN008]
MQVSFAILLNLRAQTIELYFFHQLRCANNSWQPRGLRLSIGLGEKI